VATVQEEIGVRGAHTSSDIVKPEVGIALEAGVTRDAPKVCGRSPEVLGGGPGIFLYDSSELPESEIRSVGEADSAGKIHSAPDRPDPGLRRRLL